MPVTRRGVPRWVALPLAAFVLASCTGGGSTEPSGGPSASVARGGTLHVGITTGTKRWDPQVRGDIANVAELERCCLGRTLLSYRPGTTAEGGNVLRPDLAASLPEVSSDGLTWTFHLRQGLHYGPPLQDVEITAPDIVRSLERELDPAVTGNQYTPNLYREMIAGAARYSGSGGTTTISGLEVPDPFTLRVSLNEPNGDLGYLMAFPVTSPLPPDLDNPSARYGVLDGHDDDASGYLVSSGPYMLEGSAGMDPSAGVPAAGYTPDGVRLVRNPSWDPAADPLRPAYADRIELFRVPDGRGAAWLRSGRVDLLFDQQATPREVQRALPTGRVARVPADNVYFSELNIAVPPFDDPHVRRAVAAVIDRDAVAKVLAGTQLSVPAYHMALDSQEEGLLVNFVPSWASPSNAEVDRLAAAQAEMRQSRYDRDGDGRCDAPVCSGLLALSGDFPIYPDLVDASRLVAEQLRPLGLRLDVQKVPVDTYFARSLRVHVPMWLFSGLIKDFPGASTFLRALFGSGGIEGGSTATLFNRTMVGASPGLLRRYGFPVKQVPSVDARIAACQPLSFGAAAQCWADVDRFIVEELTPTVPIVAGMSAWVYGPRIDRFTVDQSASFPTPALDAIAVTGP